MLLERFYDRKLAQAGYMVGCQAKGEALVVDPNRDSERYLAAAADEGMEIRFVTETHIHADFLSGARQLARRCGATLLLSGEGGAGWRYRFAAEDGARIVHDGDTFRVGNIRIDVLHTPGHTPEHISFLVTDLPSADAPMGLLSGDFVFVGDVGRPDLLEKAAGVANTMEAAARELYASLRRLGDAPGYLQILPGHGSGSACGKALGAVPHSTLGYERLANWAFQCATEEAFVEAVLKDQPEPPAYFARMKRMNRDGPPLLHDGIPSPPRMDPAALPGLLEGEAWVVDVRRRERFARGHVPGTLNIQLTRSFPNWAGWLLPYERPIHLMVGDEAQVAEAVRDLALIGLDHVAGYFGPEALAAWAENGRPLEMSPEVEWPAAERLVRHHGGVLIDVRAQTEWKEGHVPDARHLHLGSLRDTVDELPRDRPLLLYCRSGDRSALGQGLLLAEGFPDVRNVKGGMLSREEMGLPVARD